MTDDDSFDAPTIMQARGSMLPPVNTPSDLPADVEDHTRCYVRSDNTFYTFVKGAWQARVDE